MLTYALYLIILVVSVLIGTRLSKYVDRFISYLTGVPVPDAPSIWDNDANR